MICGEYRQMKCNQGKGKVPNAAQMETTNQPGQGSKTCAEDTGDQPKGKVPDPNWGPPKLDVF